MSTASSSTRYYDVRTPQAVVIATTHAGAWVEDEPFVEPKHVHDETYKILTERFGEVYESDMRTLEAKTREEGEMLFDVSDWIKAECPAK